MIVGIEHLGIAVSSMDKSEKLFEKLLGRSSYKKEEVFAQKVMTSFFKLGDSKVELLGATNKNSVINKFINKRGEGIHHIALAVIGIEDEIIRLKNEGFRFINETPTKGADGKKIAFLHPKSTNGLLIELCEDLE